MEWFTLVLLVFALLLLVFYMRQPKNFPPGPMAFPLVGSVRALLLMGRAPRLYDAMWDLSKQYGPVMGIFLSHNPMIVISGYQAVKQALSREEFAFRPDRILATTAFYGRRLGLIFTDGDEWREQRRFTLRHLRDFGFGKRSMEVIIHEEARALLQWVENAAEDTTNGVNLLPLLPVLAINVLWTIMAGKRHDLDDRDFRKLTDAVIGFFRAGSSFSPVLFVRVLQKIPIVNAKYKELRANIDEVRESITRTVDEHLETYDETHMRDFMDVYIKEMKAQPDGSFHKDQLCALCVDLFIAGTETTSGALGYALRYLLQHPHVQQKLRDELEQEIGTERLPAMDDVPRLHYAQAVIAETLRHSALAPIPPPHAIRQSIEFMGYTLPKGSPISINLWSVHMDPEIWGDPENFRPERFIADDGTFKKDEHLLVFGYGPRVCLGEPLARYSGLLFLTALVQRFQFDPLGDPPGDEQMSGFTTSPAPFRMLVKTLR